MKKTASSAQDILARRLASGLNAPLPHDIAERLRAAVESLGLPHERSSTAQVVTASIGAATFLASLPGATPHSLIAAADQALYEAKRSGRNRVAVVDAGFSAGRQPGPDGSSHPGLAAAS